MSLDASTTIIPGRGSVLFAPVDTAPFDFDLFDVNTPATYTGWTISHTSKDNAVALTKDGGDLTQNDSWEQEGVDSSKASTTLGWTASKLQFDQAGFEMAFGLGTNEWDATTQSYKVKELGTVKKAVIIIMIGGDGRRGGWYFPNNTVTIGDMPQVDPEAFFEVQLAGQILASESTGIRLQPHAVRPFLTTPVVTSLAPATGAEAGGDSVVITGTGFYKVTATTGVKFGSTDATSWVVDSPTQITAVSPAGTGTVDVTVTNSAGTSATSSGSSYVYAA